ncbi:matrix metalloproteinase-21-like [Enhydra lutris kenyoni]|uniref:Matrix metalloproteinase-21-like n=1 Tax=Enhydra lutris kenyoni TaxID=391180 RepID=A0A2Y9KWD2_ENHLU|nr:matrix metalloproteinase-21-like [Enhydra lutris kenyoni]
MNLQSSLQTWKHRGISFINNPLPEFEEQFRVTEELPFMGDSDHVVSGFREDLTSHFLETSNLDGEANLQLTTSEGQESKEETRDEELTRNVCRSMSGIDEWDGLKKEAGGETSICHVACHKKVTVFLPWCLAFPEPPAADLKGLDFTKDNSHTSELFHLKISSFRIINYPRDISQSTVKDIKQDAFSIWSNETPLIFQQVKNQDADIKVSFWSTAHGDCWPFDGPDGVLGHAFLPNSGAPGVIHFDRGEHWSTSDRRFSLFLVAIHELGHSQGLLLSKSLNSIMYPRYVNWDPTTFHLDGDDIKIIQQPYGERWSSEIPQS